MFNIFLASMLNKDDPIALYLMAKCQFTLHCYDIASNVIQSCFEALPNVQFKETSVQIENMLLWVYFYDQMIRACVFKIIVYYFHVQMF